MQSENSLRNLESFGSVAAEDDAVLEYFLTTDAVQRLRNNDAFLVLGRKGSGKTALVRHFTEGVGVSLSKSLNLRGYPWGVHTQRIDRGASDIEAYVSSWRYLIAVEVAALVLSRTERPQFQNVIDLTIFFKDNYGGPSPKLADILRPRKLRMTRLSFQPAVLGNKLVEIDLERSSGDIQLGVELNALSTAIINIAIEVAKNESMGPITLHFDELDQGLSRIDRDRSLLLVGLILASRELRRECRQVEYSINPIVYLRTDLWDDLEFSDKNKISESAALHLDWSSESLSHLTGERIKAKVSATASWEDIASPGLMRGSQSKWNHVIARTFLRPRDVIKFLNSALSKSKMRLDEPLIFENQDIVNARDEYSTYLKKELDDEILPHWPKWEQALQTCSTIGTLNFDREQFVKVYRSKVSNDNDVSAEDALSLLYRFSVIGYEKRSGYGGSYWVFQYTHAEAGWDGAASKFKVHLGLKEYAKLNESREARQT